MQEHLIKLCCRCGAVKPLDSFYTNPNGKHGRYSQCITCVREKNRKPVPPKPEGMKRCGKCHEWKPATKEYFSTGSETSGEILHSYCRECYRAWRRSYSEVNRARELENQRAWRERNPEKMQAKTYARTLRKRGLTKEQHQAMIVAQGNRCLICGGASTDGRALRIDHNHTTDQVRGLLCNSCNLGLGKFKDDPAILRAAAEYLERPAN